MTETAKKNNLTIKLPQINRMFNLQPVRTDRKERNLSTNPNPKLRASQIPDKLSKRY
jgi:hypothetical protein